MNIIKLILRILNFFVSISAVGTLIYFHGYKYSADQLPTHLIYLHICFGFYLIQFIIKGILTKNFSGYLKNNTLEYLIFLSLIVSMLINWIFDLSLSKWLLSATGINELDHLYILYLHIWLLVIVAIELGKVATKSTIWKLPPPLLFILSFVVLIVIGSSLLMLPEMTTSHHSMSFVDALFTSTSANCVTGLTVVDVSSFFTLKGQVILLLFIQLGGLNVIFFATFFIARFQFNRSQNKYSKTIKEFLHVDTLDGTYTKKMLRRIIYTTLIIEIIGTAFIYNQWQDHSFSSNTEQLFNSAFHSISAFNNAGFSLFSNGLTDEMIANYYSLHITIAILIILGGLGYTTIWELLRVKSFFSRKWTGSSILYGARISLIMAVLLIGIGMTLIYLFESGPSKSWHHAFFQAVTSRTAGFNTVEIGALSIGSLFAIIILMFIGASSGSTGGGIKTSTLYVLFIRLKDFILRKNAEEPFGVDSLRLLRKALNIVFYSALVILLGSIILYFSEIFLSDSSYSYFDVLFEEVSAFATVGLSTGITSELSDFGKIIVMLTMFIGRIGPLALAYTLVNSTSRDKEKPSSDLMIG